MKTLHQAAGALCLFVAGLWLLAPPASAITLKALAWGAGLILMAAAQFLLAARAKT